MSRSPVSSDDEAPEAFSFGASKKSAEGEARALQQFHAAEKQRLKDRRRQKDRVLKERKAQAKGAAKGKGKARETVFTEADDESDGGDAAPSKEDLEARMERAMREAQAEMDGDDSEHEDVEMDGTQSEGDASELDEDEADEDEADEDSEDEEEELSQIQSRPAQKDYLPDHLFATAFSQLPSKPPKTKAKAKSKQRPESPPPKKRKRVQASTKELVIGSRVVKTLPSRTARPSTTHPRGLAPAPAVNTFVRRSLNLRGDAKTAKARGWERRPANIGVMKRNGPAARFVRDD